MILHKIVSLGNSFASPVAINPSSSVEPTCFEIQGALSRQFHPDQISHQFAHHRSGLCTCPRLSYESNDVMTNGDTGLFQLREAAPRPQGLHVIVIHCIDDDLRDVELRNIENSTTGLWPAPSKMTNASADREREREREREKEKDWTLWFVKQAHGQCGPLWSSMILYGIISTRCGRFNQQEAGCIILEE